MQLYPTILNLLNISFLNILINLIIRMFFLIFIILDQYYNVPFILLTSPCYTSFSCTCVPPRTRWIGQSRAHAWTSIYPQRGSSKNGISILMTSWEVHHSYIFISFYWPSVISWWTLAWLLHRIAVSDHRVISI